MKIQNVCNSVSHAYIKIKTKSVSLQTMSFDQKVIQFYKLKINFSPFWEAEI